MNKPIKKNLMYLAGEDFYLLCYSILVLLKSSNCVGDRFFKDYRKISFLVDFVRDRKLGHILLNTELKKLTAVDREYLFSSYTSGMARRSEVLKILFILESQGYVLLERGSSNKSINIKLNEQSLPEGFLDKKVFSSEFKNCRQLLSNINRLSGLKLETMLSKIYVSNGVPTWLV